VAELNSEAEARDTETSSIYDYQQRLRENLKSLKGTCRRESPDAALHETTLRPGNAARQTARRESGPRRKGSAAQEQLDKMIEELAIQATIEPR
jgi:hypothetical protein